MELVEAPAAAPPTLAEQVKAHVDAYVAMRAAPDPETGRKGLVPNTLTSYRRALEGLVKAITDSGSHDLASLPEDFIERWWMPTQASIVDQTIQLRVRVAAVRGFMNYLRTVVPDAGVNISYPNIKTPPPKPKLPEDPPMSNDPLNQFTDPNSPDSVPQVQTFAPTAIPPPAPRMPTVKPRANPLAAMLPGADYKLRVYREKDNEEIYAGEYSAARVQAIGSIEEFLLKEVGPKYRLTGDHTFWVTPVDPASKAPGPRSRIMVMFTDPGLSSMAPQSIPAPVAGGAVLPSTLAEATSELRSIQERREQDIESRVKSAVESASRGQNSDEVRDLRDAVSNLTRMVETLANRVMKPEVAAPAPATNDSLAVVREVLAHVAPKQAVETKKESIAEVFALLTQAKSIFQPQNIAVDTSPLEEEMREIRTKLETNQPKGIAGLIKDFKEMKELFTVVGGESGAKKPTSLSEALGSLVMKVVEDPNPLANAVAHVIQSTRRELAAEQAQQKPQLPPALVETTKEMLAAEEVDLLFSTHQWFNQLMAFEPTKAVVKRMGQLLNEQQGPQFHAALKLTLKNLGFEVPNDRLVFMTKSLLASVAKVAAENQQQESQEGEDTPPDLTIRVGGSAQEDDDVHDGHDGEGEEDEGADDGGDDDADGDAEDGAEEDSAAADGDDSEAVEDEAHEDGTADEDAGADEGADGETTPIEDVPDAEEVEAALVASARKRRRSRKDAEVIQLTDVAEGNKPGAKA